jgi:peptidoglycan/xylan/chitin deacetylase (PgdA/CDA1 family)
MTGDRDFIGYGANAPDPQWPGRARIAVNINLNFEGGHEIVSHGYRWLDYQTIPEDIDCEQNLAFSTGEDFACYMIDCFEVMYGESAEHPKLMSFGRARPADRAARPYHWARQIPRLHRHP